MWITLLSYYYFRIGTKKYHNDDKAGAQICFNKLLDIDPYNTTAWIFKGLCEEKNDIAITYFDKALKLSPDNSHIIKLIAERLNKDGKQEEAIKCFEDVLKKNPYSPELWYEKGLMHDRQGNLEEAMKCMDMALHIKENNNTSNSLTFFPLPDIHPTRVSIFEKKGKILKKQGKIKEAFQYFDEMTTLSIYNISGWKEKGIILYDRGEYEEAFKCYNQVLKIIKDDRKSEDCFYTIKDYASAWMDKGIALYNIKMYKEAIKCFNEAIKLDKKQIEALRYKGLSLYNTGKYKDAVIFFDKFLTQKPYDPEITKMKEDAGKNIQPSSWKNLFSI